jgi:hypothetical protein
MLDSERQETVIQSNNTNGKKKMWKSLFIAGASVWALTGHAATLSMQRVGTGMQVRTDEGVLTIEPVAPREVYERLYRRVYLKMYRQLQPLYREIAEITGYPKR